MSMCANRWMCVSVGGCGCGCVRAIGIIRPAANIHQLHTGHACA